MWVMYLQKLWFCQDHYRQRLALWFHSTEYSEEQNQHKCITDVINVLNDKNLMWQQESRWQFGLKRNIRRPRPDCGQKRGDGLLATGQCDKAADNTE